MSRIPKLLIGFMMIGLAVGFVLGQASREYLSTGRLSAEIAAAVHDSIGADVGDTRSVAQIELILRKLAHFIEYLILGSIVYAVARHWIRNKFLIISIVLLVAVPIPFIDEFVIQSKTLGRSSQMLDVYIDLLAVGVSVAIALFYDLAFTWMHRKV